MGNCLRHQSSIGSATDGEWDDFPAAAEEGGSLGSSEKRRREVKIKITKKELEELIGKVDLKELRVEQVLAQLMKHSLNRPWRPNLQSIPED